MTRIPYNALAELDDATLIDMVRSGNDDALEIVLDRYRGYARSKGNTYYLPGSDREDVIQEGMIGVYKAIRDYDSAKGPLSAFVELCVVRQLHTAVKGANRLKHRSLSVSAPLESLMSNDHDDALSLSEIIPDTGVDPAELIASADAVDRLRDSLTELLTSLEREVLGQYVAGRSYQEIADWLGSSLKSIDNALQRVKHKFQRHFQPGGEV